MFFKLKKKVITIFFFATIFLCIGIFISYKFMFHNKKIDNTVSIPFIQNQSVKYITEETVVSKLKNTQKILPLEAEISETMIIDNSWGDCELFKKIKTIKYFALATYTLDLSNFTKSNVSIDQSNKKITLNLDKPILNSINLLNDKTTYETTNNGTLRFGELKLSPEELNSIEKQALKQMSEKSNEDSLVKLAEENSKSLLNNIINSINNSDMLIEINFK
ncbi:Protein of unknown function [Clostridium cavendishii DSM 21758]|uniref:DUF4230 domain-containing protein n=1 Tax=Clostridium cavendishii DSM 21758 TaxID=1121302 RepID=A0A1M6SZE6_9CLOT|nr:DUF4230 domain-containing protein [Clostridium cavendishii]SHK50095.1 Protein of unknown function [Clostridium cavendishii DSM 21758]